MAGSASYWLPPCLKAQTEEWFFRRQAGAVPSVWALMSYTQGWRSLVGLYKPAALGFSWGGDSLSVLCSCETPVDYCIPAQEQHEPVREGPEEGHENRVRIPLLGKKAERGGVALPVGRGYEIFQYIKGL